MSIRARRRCAASAVVVLASILMAAAPAAASGLVDSQPASRACTQWFWQSNKQCKDYREWCEKNHAGYTVDSDMFGLAKSFQCKLRASNGQLYDVDP